jgi:hypothetical protein
LFLLTINDNTEEASTRASGTSAVMRRFVFLPIEAVNINDKEKRKILEKCIGKSICFHLHFFMNKVYMLEKRIYPTNKESITIPPSHILKNLQGRSLNIYITSPYFSYGDQYHMYPVKSPIFDIMYPTLLIPMERSREIVYTSKMEDLSFPVSIHPLQNMYIPDMNTKTSINPMGILETKSNI